MSLYVPLIAFSPGSSFPWTAVGARRDTKFYEETSARSGPVAEGVTLPDVVARLTGDKDTYLSTHTFRACLPGYVRALIPSVRMAEYVRFEWKMNAHGPEYEGWGWELYPILVSAGINVSSRESVALVSPVAGNPWEEPELDINLTLIYVNIVFLLFWTSYQETFVRDSMSVHYSLEKLGHLLRVCMYNTFDSKENRIQCNIGNYCLLLLRCSSFLIGKFETFVIHTLTFEWSRVTELRIISRNPMVFYSLSDY